MGITKREATLDELLSDPLMATVLQHARTTPDDVRAMMRDARERLARAASPTAIVSWTSIRRSRTTSRSIVDPTDGINPPAGCPTFRDPDEGAT